MATEPVSLPHNNSLQALKQLVEDRKREVRDTFLELRTALQQCEESVTGNLDRLYSDTRESVESSERIFRQLEEAKNAMQATLVDNKMNLFLQATIQSIDAQIAEVRNSTALVPKRIQLEWRRDAKQYIQTLCKVISSTDDSSCSTGAPEPIPQPAQQIGTEIELLEREEKHKQTISLLEGRVADKEKLLSYKAEELRNLDEEMGRSKSLLNLRDKENTDLSQQLAALQKITSVQENQLKDQQEERVEKRERVSQLEAELRRLQQELAEREAAWQLESGEYENRLGECNMKSELELDQVKKELSRYQIMCESLKERLSQAAQLGRDTETRSDAGGKQAQVKLAPPDGRGEETEVRPVRRHLGLEWWFKEGSSLGNETNSELSKHLQKRKEEEQNRAAQREKYLGRDPNSCKSQ